MHRLPIVSVKIGNDAILDLFGPRLVQAAFLKCKHNSIGEEPQKAVRIPDIE
jgi:hypothetical protein